MIVKSIALENIRSYLNETIDFPTGSILLSGDIGSGKSTILLAIEFALFGVKRKELSGAALLRHGKNSGSVQLKLEIQGQEILIKRFLKRAKEDVKQEAGYIVKGGKKKEATHLELKTEILELLGYPAELVTKSKDLVYRYTVYTPQEAMKQIILEDKDIRLDTLRKVFDVDRYKRIRENVQVYTRELKDRRKTYEGRIADLQEKQKLKKEKANEKKKIEDRMDQLLPEFVKSKTEVDEKRKLLDIMDKQKTELNKRENQLEIQEGNLKNKLQNRKNALDEVDKLGKEIKKLESELKQADSEKVGKYSDKEKEKQALEKKMMRTTGALSELETKKRLSASTLDKVMKLDKCPMCLQQVTEEHKNSIKEREAKIILDSNRGIESFRGEYKKYQQELEKIEKDLDMLRKRQLELKALELKKKELEEKGRKKDELEKRCLEIKKEIGQINMEKLELRKRIESFGKLDEEYRILRSALDKAQKNEKEIESSVRELKGRKDEMGKLINMLDQEIKSRLDIKEKLKNIVHYINWLEDNFVRLVASIEKHVMLQVHREFNDLFQTWFNMLLNDETINVRLNDEFSPVVEQNGYETSIISLSGGERTSIALAYRLALNRVINDVISQIRTKDIIILDEPTDGFSSEQLDKLRDVLDELRIKQVILVSHENKIESFVDNVIRIEKREHISRAVF